MFKDNLRTPQLCRLQGHIFNSIAKHGNLYLSIFSHQRISHYRYDCTGRLPRRLPPLPPLQRRYQKYPTRADLDFTPSSIIANRIGLPRRSTCKPLPTAKYAMQIWISGLPRYQSLTRSRLDLSYDYNNIQATKRPVSKTKYRNKIKIKKCKKSNPNQILV